MSIVGIATEGHEELSPINAYVPQADLMGAKLLKTAKKLTDDPHAVFQIDVPHSYIDKGSVGECGG